jgi:hypothetical protein
MQKVQPCKKTLNEFLKTMKPLLSHELYLLLCHYTNEYENMNIDKVTMSNISLRIQTTKEITPEEKKIIYNQLEDGPLKEKICC